MTDDGHPRSGRRRPPSQVVGGASGTLAKITIMTISLDDAIARFAGGTTYEGDDHDRGFAERHRLRRALFDEARGWSPRVGSAPAAQLTGTGDQKGERMSASFEEIDRRPTPMGDISLRRRRDPASGNDVYEVKLGDEFLMPSLFTAGEIALTQLGLAKLPGTELDVAVGGLGLGYTAQAAPDAPPGAVTDRGRGARRGDRVARAWAGVAGRPFDVGLPLPAGPGRFLRDGRRPERPGPRTPDPTYVPQAPETSDWKISFRRSAHPVTLLSNGRVCNESPTVRLVARACQTTGVVLEPVNQQGFLPSAAASTSEDLVHADDNGDGGASGVPQRIESRAVQIVALSDLSPDQCGRGRRTRR